MNIAVNEKTWTGILPIKTWLPFSSEKVEQRIACMNKNAQKFDLLRLVIATVNFNVFFCVFLHFAV